ncbi:MAG: hypothetical protein M0Q95_17290 [Porticoccaceae bacterium]|nr:hypothetical protein [Porticoccaceae bacterium]
MAIFEHVYQLVGIKPNHGAKLQSLHEVNPAFSAFDLGNIRLGFVQQRSNIHLA